MSKIKLACIGAGPSNLSVAALCYNLKQLEITLFEKSKSVDWHPGLMFPDARIQVSYLKDLVTPVDPTNPYSFLNYLCSTERFYKFVSANYHRITRREFRDYLVWVGNQLPNIKASTEVDQITHSGQEFELFSSGRKLATATDISIGVGQTPSIPDACLSLSEVYELHSSNFLSKNPTIEGKEVVIIGSGQSGAEIFLEVATGSFGRPKSIFWITRSERFMPIDETALTNEIFTPRYTEYFWALSSRERKEKNINLRFASDGISPDTMQQIYRCLYRHHLQNDAPFPIKLITEHELMDVRGHAEPYRLTLRNKQGQVSIIPTNKLVLATGYETKFPTCLLPLQDQLVQEGDFPSVQSDYSLVWKANRKGKIFVSNFARHTHGVADPNLSLMARRSSTIVNSLVGEKVYPDPSEVPLIDWAGQQLFQTYGTSLNT